MINNFNDWNTHYHEILIPYYDSFAYLFEKEKMKTPTVREFIFYCYLNTKKSNVNGKLIAPVY